MKTEKMGKGSLLETNLRPLRKSMGGMKKAAIPMYLKIKTCEIHAPPSPSQFWASLPQSIIPERLKSSTTLWSAFPVNRYDKNATNKYREVMIRKNPVARMSLGSFKNSKLILDFDFGPLPLFSFSGFLNVLDLYVFSAICNLEVKLTKLYK